MHEAKRKQFDWELRWRIFKIGSGCHSIGYVTILVLNLWLAYWKISSVVT